MSLTAELIGPDMSGERWAVRASCRARIQAGLAESWWWFPDPAQAQEAKKLAVPVCEACPVLVECRAWALQHERYGTWGGLTEAQRRRIKADRVERVCPECKAVYVTNRGTGGQQEVTCSPVCREQRRDRQREEADRRRGVNVGRLKAKGHGTRHRYVDGCRCKSCTKAQREYQRAYRAGAVA